MTSDVYFGALTAGKAEARLSVRDRVKAFEAGRRSAWTVKRHLGPALSQVEMDSLQHNCWLSFAGAGIGSHDEWISGWKGELP